MELKIECLSKSYDKGKKQALDNINLTLTEGVYGLLGPNGAGKSTLMHIITNNIKPDKGYIKLNNQDISKQKEKFRNILGYVPQQQGIYDDFSGIRFLWYMSALKGIKKNVAKERIEYVLDLLNLKEHAYKKIGSYSGGMKQRILIAQGLLNDPKILILDEPTVGLDPKERIKIRNFISEISISKIIILATHVVSDIEYISKEIILLKKGKVVLKGSQLNLLNNIKDKVFEVYINIHELQEIQKKYIVSNISPIEHGVCARIISEIVPENIKYKKVNPNLEDLYLYMFCEK